MSSLVSKQELKVVSELQMSVNIAKSLLMPKLLSCIMQSIIALEPWPLSRELAGPASQLKVKMCKR